MDTEILEQLVKTLHERKNADPDQSYVAKLYKKGPRKIAQKIGEEAAEVIIDAIRLDEKPKSEKRRAALKEELADLMFHIQVLLAHFDIPPQEILGILANRMGVSGLEEKASRKGD